MSNITIAIPPFPSQDLAKLVLGYLAEEQLMTAYDEFLQASPYLDALQNEYDRIFMTSLKNILAEYRAVRIYVETCKPFILRKKLFQCTNLLEIVKFLVSNVDVNKLHLQDGNIEKVGHSRQSFSKSTPLCDVCISLKLSNCVCRSSQFTSQIEAASLIGSVETTSLADLPGNATYNKKITKESEFKNNMSHSITSSDQTKYERSDSSVQCLDRLSSTIDGNDTTDNVISSVTNNKCPNNTSPLTNENELELRHIVQNVNDDLISVSYTRDENNYEQPDVNNPGNIKNAVDTDMLQKIVTDGNSDKVIVPDSSTSENIILQTSTTENDPVMNSKNTSKKVTRHPPSLIRLGNEHKKLSLQHSLPRLAVKESIVNTTNTKTEDENTPKITILSDVKVDNDMKMPPILKSTPTSLVQMQTLFINGTPAYKSTPLVDQAFTKAEIMAMPTIILVPAADNTKKIVPTVTQNNMLNNSSDTVSCSTSQRLEPLVIDVSSNEATSSEINNKTADNTIKTLNNEICDSGLIKTVEVVSVSHASLPKDNNLAGLKASTPHILPPTRKSSSTPRRTSHVRVLDFTTPRRILHETLNEQEAKDDLSTSNEIILSKEVDSHPINNNLESNISKVNSNSGNIDTNSETYGAATKENKTSIKLYNWDAELRAHAYIGNGSIEKSGPARKSKLKKTKSKTTPKSRSHKKSEDPKANKSNDKKKVVSKDQKPKNDKEPKECTDKIFEDVEEKAPVSVVKPTINIISRKKWAEPIETEKNQNKSNGSDGNIDTPELEKVSLQHEISAKFNISDFLETPYKQALYDIQMDTPKYLGPDIPDVPLSDLKIMNIPTPRFLNTPKLPQNTPSSYSSRHTDYSSGGSYYKPDDQDYILANEVIEDALSASAGTLITNKEVKAIEVDKVNIEKQNESKSRPVRQCTKNVSYNYGTPSSNKVKDIEDKLEKYSTSSETSSHKTEKKMEKPKFDKGKDADKRRETKKKGKKYKSPMKKDTPKTFMKIKPRRTTPVKEILGKVRKKTNDLNQSVCVKPQIKKGIVGKERNVSFSSTAIAAVPTKSRRKSSTPRKLQCTKRFNSDSSSINSLERKKQILLSSEPQVTNLSRFCTQESDAEQQPLRWSDDGSQESDAKTTEDKTQDANESDDITRIKEYIKTTTAPNVESNKEGEGTLQVDLIKRGFDVETARRIERDLLETSTLNLSNLKTSVHNVPQTTTTSTHIYYENKDESESKKSDKSTESDSTISNNLQIVQDESDNGEFDLSVYECNEDTNNYFIYKYDEAKFVKSNQVKLKETFSMEICIEDDTEIRLRATPYSTIFEQEEIVNFDKKSIDKPASLHYNTLYTPRKAQCYEIFDSTLTSLDTPLKAMSPNAKEFGTVTEIVLEVEKLETDIKLKPESKKRKRVQSGTSDDSLYSNKKVKPDTSYLLNSAGIQNIDIESVLSKLHGP